MSLFTNLFEEYISSKKLRDKRSNKKSNNSLEKFVTNKKINLNLEQQTDLHLENKINVLEDFIENLKQKFIFKKITDICKNIRSMISEYIVKISKNHFSEFFDDDSIKFYPYFLIDPIDKIKLRYLQIIYEKLDNMNENDFECLIKILKESRDLILNICIKEEKTIAKRGIKIIELISKQNILDIKTVNLLLPHLFNPDANIRYLISNIVLNYVLNFENRDIINEMDEEDQENSECENEEALNKKKTSKISRNDLMDICDYDENDMEEKGKNDNKKSEYKYTLENLIEIFEFFSKLTEKDQRMIKVLVDSFYPKMSVFKNYTLFFDFIEFTLNRSFTNEKKINEIDNTNNPHMENYTLLKICLIVLKFSIEKLQEEIEAFKSSVEQNNFRKELIIFNEDFLNNFITRISSYIRKIIINEELFFETFIEITNLFENFKIYNYNLIKFDFGKVYDILEELKKVFFYKFLKKDKNKVYFSNINFMSNSLENIGKIIVKLINFLSLNNINEEAARYDENNFIKELCLNLYDYINPKIFQSRIIDDEEINYEINLEDAEEFLSLFARLDCALNYFGGIKEILISEINNKKLQNLIFNFIFYYRKKEQFYITSRISSNETFSNNIITNKNTIKEAFNINTKQSKIISLKDKSQSYENPITELEINIKNNEFFLQTFTIYGLKLIKTLNLNLLTKIIFNIDSIYEESEKFMDESTIKIDHNSFNFSGINKSELFESYETHLKCINNFLKHLQIILKLEFEYKIDNLNINLKKNEIQYQDLQEDLVNFIQDKNLINLEIKSHFVCLFLELIIYISSEKLDIYSLNTDFKLKFQINDSILVSIEKFIKKEFIFFYYMNGKKLKELNDELKTIEILLENNEEIEDSEIENSKLLIKLKDLIEKAISSKTVYFKNICESFSKLLIQNLGVFKNRNLVSLFFESFLLLKYPILIESINNIVFENLLEKEISYYIKDEENNKINWMIFYFTKIAVKLFSKSSSLFNFDEFVSFNPDNSDNTMDINAKNSENQHEIKNKNNFNFYEFFYYINYSTLENYQFKSIINDSNQHLYVTEDEKIIMLKRYFDVYLKTHKKIKGNFNKEFSKAIENKDKQFLVEFICKSFNYSLLTKTTKNILVDDVPPLNKTEDINENSIGNIRENIESNSNELKYEKRIFIENIKFLDLIKYLLKNCHFITDNEYKTFLMLFVKLSKNIENTDNINRSDIKMIESTKNFLVKKANLFINNDEKEKEKSINDEPDNNKLLNEDTSSENEGVVQVKRKSTKNKAKKSYKNKEIDFPDQEYLDDDNNNDENEKSIIKEESKIEENSDNNSIGKLQKGKQKKNGNSSKDNDTRSLSKSKNPKRKNGKEKEENSNLNNISENIGKKRKHEDVSILKTIKK